MLLRRAAAHTGTELSQTSYSRRPLQLVVEQPFDEPGGRLRAISSGGERHHDKVEARGSNPLSPTTGRPIMRLTASCQEFPAALDVREGETVMEPDDNDVIGVTRLGPFTINVRERDRRLGEMLGLSAETQAVARQPLGRGWEAFDLTEDSWTP